jgi:ubiquinone/menaquinone biosynthesis C-methylase UbiE
MAQVARFTQPDNSPAYFIDFLSFLDQLEEIQRVRAEAEKHLKVSVGQKVLDLGCGIGGATFRLLNILGPAGLAAGVDISSAMVEAATSRAENRPGVEFRVGEACAIPYPDQFFDAARCERVFLYLPDRLAAIQEMKRVVKPGGQIVLLDTELDCTAIYSKNPQLTRKMTSAVAATMPNPNSARDLPALAREAGLKDIRVQTLAVSSPYEFFLKVIATSLEKAAEQETLPANEVHEFLEEQRDLNSSGNFFHAWLFVLVSGSV